MPSDLGSKALCGQKLVSQTSVPPGCKPIHVVLRWVGDGSGYFRAVLEVMGGKRWGFGWWCWKEVLEKHLKVGYYCTSEVISWMQLLWLCGFGFFFSSFKSVVCLALSRYQRGVFRHCAFEISMLNPPGAARICAYADWCWLNSIVTKHTLGNLIWDGVGMSLTFCQFSEAVR